MSLLITMGFFTDLQIMCIFCKKLAHLHIFNGAFMTEWNAEELHAFKFHTRTIKCDMKVFLQDQRPEDDFSDKDRFHKLSFGSS